MKVIDLIIQLQQLPPNLPVMLDFTEDNAGMFHFKECGSAEEIGLSDGTNIVSLSMNPYDDEGENLN